MMLNSKTGILLAVLFLQLVLLSITFPISELFSAKPLFYIDNAMHWYRLKVASALSSNPFAFVYDPFFGAGSPGGATRNPAAKLPALFQFFTGNSFTEIQAWKIYTFMSALLAPACVTLASQILRLKTQIVIIASLFALLLWWASMFRWFHTAGLVSYVSVSFFAVFYFSLLVRFFEQKEADVRLSLLLGVLGALFFIVHPLFFIPAVFSTLILLFFYRANIDGKKCLFLFLLIPFIALLPNLLWVYPQFFQKIYKGFSTGLTHQALVEASLIWKEALGIWQEPAHGAKLYPALVLSSVAALFVIDDLRTRRLALSIFSLALFLIFYSAFGSALEMLGELTQPNRFNVMGYLFLSLVGAMGVWGLYERFTQTANTRHKAIFAGLLVPIGLISLVSINEARLELATGNHGRYGAAPPEVKGTGDYTDFLLKQIPQLTGTQERVLFETANGRVHDGSHIAGYLAVTSQREFIGGPYPYSHFAGYWDGFVFGKEIQEHSQDKMKKYLALYNIGLIVAYSDASKNYWNQSPLVISVAEFKQVRLYSLKAKPPGLFSLGSGQREESKHNSIKFTGVKGDEVIIKYHRLKGLRASPEVKMESVYLEDDPNPFIKIISPPEAFELHM
ncbi:MAG: hypothetical protein OEX00_02225 [Gammaproteobacteria bacterium]|nr:hypothetical protein [Gammaproteobacteria bacterium]MDH5694373.1 hypothetical protein [Gammaproteobacteria bacterium]